MWVGCVCVCGPLLFALPGGPWQDGLRAELFRRWLGGVAGGWAGPNFHMSHHANVRSHALFAAMRGSEIDMGGQYGMPFSCLVLFLWPVGFMALVMALMALVLGTVRPRSVLRFAFKSVAVLRGSFALVVIVVFGVC